MRSEIIYLVVDRRDPYSTSVTTYHSIEEISKVYANCMDVDDVEVYEIAAKLKIKRAVSISLQPSTPINNEQKVLADKKE